MHVPQTGNALSLLMSSAGRSHLPFQLSQFINSESGLNPFGEAAKFLAQALGFGGVVVLDGVLISSIALSRCGRTMMEIHEW